MYTEECIQTFLEKQEQLFDEPVAETYEEAEEFLEDCMAVVADSIDEVRKYLSCLLYTSINLLWMQMDW